MNEDRGTVVGGRPDVILSEAKDLGSLNQVKNAEILRFAQDDKSLSSSNLKMSFLEAAGA